MTNALTAKNWIEGHGYTVKIVANVLTITDCGKHTTSHQIDAHGRVSVREIKFAIGY